MIELPDLLAARTIVYRSMPPTPQYCWPLLSESVGADLWVKHENHTPTGAFKVRGGLVYLDRLRTNDPGAQGIISATRGNHGQSLAFAATRQDMPCRVVVPHGNSSEKNAAMRAFGADLIEHGSDFDDARLEAERLADTEALHMVPSFHRDLVAGVASYGLELFEAVPDLDVVYAPLGLGSGMCGLIAARDALGLSTRIVGVVSENAAAYALSWQAGRVVEVNSVSTFADGIAVRIPSAEALQIIRNGADRLVRVSEDDIAEAVRLFYRSTHNLAEGAGAAPLAGALSEKDDLKGQKVGVILSGQNIDTDWFQQILGGETPKPR